MTRSFRTLLIFMGKLAISAGMVYAHIVEPGIGWAENLATGLFVGRVALAALIFLLLLAVVFLTETKSQQDTIVHTEKEQEEYVKLRGGMVPSLFGSFLGYVDGILIIGVLAALGWFWAMSIWLLFFEVVSRMFIANIRGNIKIIDRKLQEQEKKEAEKA